MHTIFISENQFKIFKLNRDSILKIYKKEIQSKKENKFLVRGVSNVIKDCEKIIVKCEQAIDMDIFNIVCKNINSNIKKFEDFFGVSCSKIEITFLTKERLDTVAKIETLQYKNSEVPKWVVGFSTSKKIYVILPTMENLEEISKVTLHEIVHLISYKLNNKQKRLKILDEGIAVFLSNQYAGKILTPWVNAYLNGDLPKVSDFCTSDGIIFAKLKGYQYCHMIIEFLLLTYGKENFLKWLQEPDSFMEMIEKIDTEFYVYISKKIEARI